MKQYYVQKMVAISTIVEAESEEAAVALANKKQFGIAGSWEYEWDDIETVEEAAE